MKQLSADRVRAVTERLPEAIAKLEKRSAVLLSDQEVRRFIEGPGAAGSGHRLRPYLVRAVYPIGNPSLDVRWDGRRLDVFAGGLGCAPFTKNPIVVFLEQQPAQVFVMASADL